MRDLEELASDVRRRARIGPQARALATDIAVALVGERGVIIDPELAGSAYVIQRGDRFRIIFRLDAPDIRFRLMHECAHVALRKLAKLELSPEDEERAANYVAAAIIAPRGQVLCAYADLGERPRTMAAIFGLSQTAMVLRLAEVLEDERSVVTTGRTTGERNVLVRNAREVDWSDPEIIVEADRRRRHPKLAKTRLRGGIDEGRVALRVR